MTAKQQSIAAVLIALLGVAAAWGFLDHEQASALSGAIPAILVALHLDFGVRKPKK